MKVLIVDDSSLSRKVILRDVCQIPDVEILEAASGEEAVTLALREGPDLITMDVEMPGMDGITAAAKIRRYPGCSHVPIVMISSKTDEVIKKIAFSAGANVFFEKPFEGGKLLTYINELMDHDDVLTDLSVLIADDSSLMRTLIASAVKIKGAEVIEVEDAMAAVEILEERHIDLLITDLVMPGMDGVDLISYIRQDLDNKDLPIILLTAVADQAIQIEALRAGADDFLIKPFSREELLSRINNHYRRIKVARSLNEQLYSVQKMEQVGFLLSGVMHDANNALSNIGGLAFLAQHHLDDKEKTDQELSSIQSEVARGAELIKQLLSFARKDHSGANHQVLFSLGQVIDEVLALFSLSKLNGITMTFNSVAPSIQIEGSKAHISQVMLNLLNNAKHALKGCKNAEITIHTTILNANDIAAPANHKRTFERDMVHIAVSDNGCGIAEEEVRNIFDPFYTTKTADEGTGLGLSMIKRSIAAHHGAVDVESKPNQGTCFHIYLPYKHRGKKACHVSHDEQLL